jgi:DNA repair exonuclease SbcCD ATPase subunit
MRLTSLRLKGFKRFALSQIKDFEIDLNADLQIILGTNGSGKSSLLEQLTPEPPVPTDFEKDGCKVLKLEFNQTQYVLTSDFSKSRAHSFMMGDRELNEGGTVTVQKELVRSHFKLTSEIIRLMLGDESFTGMSASKRKEWFIRLCDTNYDYAIGLYNRMRERLRDVQGALKIAKNNLVAESEKLLGENVLKEYNERLDVIHAYLTGLIEVRKPVEHPLEMLEADAIDLDRKMLKSAAALEKLLEQVVSLKYSPEELNRQIEDVSNQLISVRSAITQLTQVFSDNQKRLDVLKRANNQSIDDLIKQVKDGKKEIDRLSLLVLDIEPVVNSSEQVSRYRAVRPQLIEMFLEIPKNPDSKFSQHKLIAAKEERSALNMKLVSANEQLSKVKASIGHQEEHKNTPKLKCPKCEHGFSAVYDEKIFLDLVSRKSSIEKHIVSFEEKLKEFDTYVEECSQYALYYRQYVGITNNNPGLSVYWKWLLSSNAFTINSDGAAHLLNQIDQDLERRVEIEQFEKIIREKTQLIQSLEEVGTPDLESLQNQNEELDLKIGYLNSKYAGLSIVKERCVYDLSVLSAYDKIEKEVLSLLSEKKELANVAKETIRRDCLNRLIRSVQAEIAEKERIVSSAKTQKSIISSLEFNISVLVEEEVVLADLCKIMSPSEGLIAEGLFGFIKNFTDQMNVIIGKVWSYPLIVKTCVWEENGTIDLDYKFPFNVDDGERDIKDVSMGSSGILEIVDLAFRLTAMQYLNLGTVPLYLDEEGKAFDLQHRSDFANMVKTMLEQNCFSQIFLISHYFEIYGGMSNHETCVLNGLNIATPSTYNQHVKITT